MVAIGINSSLNSNLLSLFGTSLPSSSPTMSATAGFQVYVANENQQIAKFSQEATTQQAVTYFKNHIGKIKSVQQLTQDPKLLSFVLTAFGLSADAQYPAKIAAVLNSDLSKTTSFANNLIDPRYQQLAKEFDVHDFGMFQFSNSSVVGDVVNRYLTNAYETSLDNVNGSLREAAYFLRNIGSITSAYNILADPVLRNVFETVTGLPANIAVLPIQDEANLVTSKVNIKLFETSASGSSSSSSSGSSATSPLGVAQTDLTNLNNAKSVVTPAQAAVQSIVDQITAIQTAQQNVANLQSATGPVASEIQPQQNAAPFLLEQQGLLAAAQNATGTVNSDVTQLQALVKQAGDPNNTAPISQLQSEFTTLYNQITSTIQNTTYQFDNGTGGATFTSLSLINGSVASSITSPAYNSTGSTVTISPQNLGAGSSFRTQLDAAAAAFGSGTPDLATAAASLSSAATTANNATTAINSDAATFNTAIAGVQNWAGTYNTTQLYAGAQAVSDAGSRLTDINRILGQIQTIAQQTVQTGVTAGLQADYTTLISQLTSDINTPGQTGLDNLLNGSGTFSYNVGTLTSGPNAGNSYDIQAQGNDLVTNVLNQLNTLDLSSASNAQAVISAATGTTVTTAIAGASQNLNVEGQYFQLATNKIDPAAAVYTQYSQLASSVAGLVSKAAVGTQNLLSQYQQPITVFAGTASQVVTINPETAFDANVTQVLAAGQTALLSNPTQAFTDLSNAAFSANGALGDLNNALTQIQYATDITNAKIKTLNQQQAKSSANQAGLKVNATQFAIQFVQKFLAISDSQSSTNNASNAYLLQLVQPLQGSGSSALLGASLNIKA